MSITEQNQLDQLAQLDGRTGQAMDLAHACEEIGFEIREDDETGDALIVLMGARPDGGDVIAGTIICDDENSRIVI